jgi:hypothetical protein
MPRTMFLVDFCIPLVAIAAKHRNAMRPVRDSGPRRSPKLPQLGIRCDRPEDIEAQEAAEERHSLPK